MELSHPYTEEMKWNVVKFIMDHDAQNGGGGLEAANAKFQINPISLKSWSIRYTKEIEIVLAETSGDWDTANELMKLGPAEKYLEFLQDEARNELIAELDQRGYRGYHEAGNPPDCLFYNITQGLIDEIGDTGLVDMLDRHISLGHNLLAIDDDSEYAKSISREFYLVLTNSNIHWDICNGTFDQLFARYSKSDASLICDFHESYQILKTDSTAIFQEAIQLYSHFHENVNQAREQLGFLAVEKQTTSDIVARYFEASESLDKVTGEFIRRNAEQFYACLVEI